ncbi:MAG: hypothetical protein G8345_09020 [Magnetococcales bacterium]|nr:hypothetical protein [Magnetococcales bacterium]NGZ27017.1 hypothetical protein [Magnetococcales bacterium]
MATSKLFLVVCEGSSDFALIEGILLEAGERLKTSFKAELIAPSPDATRDEDKKHGWSQVKNWCRNYSRHMGSILALKPAHGYFIQMDTDIAELIHQDGEGYQPSCGLTRRRWCECAMQQWLAAARLPTHALHLLLPTYRIENWLLAAYADQLPSQKFTPPVHNDYETLQETDTWLLQVGFKEDREKPGKIYKEETLYREKHLPTLLKNRTLIQQRCSEFNYFQTLLHSHINLSSAQTGGAMGQPQMKWGLT